MSEDIKEVLRSNKVPFMGTGELADHFDMTNPGITTHLNRAVEAGEIGKAAAGGYNVWYLPEIEPDEPGYEYGVADQFDTTLQVVGLAIAAVVGIGILSVWPAPTGLGAPIAVVIVALVILILMALAFVVGTWSGREIMGPVALRYKS